MTDSVDIIPGICLSAIMCKEKQNGEETGWS